MLNEKKKYILYILACVSMMKMSFRTQVKLSKTVFCISLNNELTVAQHLEVLKALTFRS